MLTIENEVTSEDIFKTYSYYIYYLTNAITTESLSCK